MKNKEKNSKKIVELACDGEGIAVDKHSGTVDSCLCIPCSNCLFNDNKDCDKGRREWAESEYIKKQVISKSDKAFLEYLREEYKYIARDKNDILCVCESAYWYWGDGSYFRLNPHFDIDFPMVKWSDEKLWLIEDLKRLEVVENYE